MASIRRKPGSKFWYACYTDPGGKQRQRSTKETNRKNALRIAESYERAYRSARTEHQARQVIAGIYAEIHGDDLVTMSTRKYLNGWLNRRELEVARASLSRYSTVVAQFLESLGERADRDISYLTARDIAAFRNGLVERLSVATANTAVKILRSALKQALRDGLIQVNPADQVSTLKEDSDRIKRRPLTIDELKKVLEVADGEWQSIILTGVYTGQRLGDIGRLRWSNVDLARGEIMLTARKTGRRIVIPVAGPLREHFLGMPTPSKSDTPVFPKAFAVIERDGDVSVLSQQFAGILVEAGLAKAQSKKPTGKGRSTKRKTNELSFHSLRHTATSLMKNAGIPAAVVQDIIGHDSVAVSQHYTVIDLDSKRRAVDAMPVFRIEKIRPGVEAPSS